MSGEWIYFTLILLSSMSIKGDNSNVYRDSKYCSLVEYIYQQNIALDVHTEYFV